MLVLCTLCRQLGAGAWCHAAKAETLSHTTQTRRGTSLETGCAWHASHEGNKNVL